jgi:hypothetical protein
MTREHVDGFLVVGSPHFFLQRTLLSEPALKHRLPGVFATREYAEASGLISYGAVEDAHALDSCT